MLHTEQRVELAVDGQLVQLVGAHDIGEAVGAAVLVRS